MSVANLPPSLSVKEFRKSVNIWGSYRQEFSVFFSDSRCTCTYLEKQDYACHRQSPTSKKKSKYKQWKSIMQFFKTNPFHLPFINYTVFDNRSLIRWIFQVFTLQTNSSSWCCLLSQSYLLLFILPNMQQKHIKSYIKTVMNIHTDTKSHTYQTYDILHRVQKKSDMCFSIYFTVFGQILWNFLHISVSEHVNWW